MKVFVVHAHPEPKSFNGAMTRTAVSTLSAAGHDVKVSDLYQMNWQPISDRRNFKTIKDDDFYKQQLEELHASENEGFADDIRLEHEKLDWCDLLIFQFPLWWFGLPAILKGWVDRVFVMGKIYGGGVWYDEGYFKGKRALCSVTVGGPASSYGVSGINGDIDQILFPINHGILYFVGFDVVRPFIVHGPARMSESERRKKLNDYVSFLLRADSFEIIKYKKLADYGTTFVADQKHE